MPISAVDTIQLAFQHTKRQLVQPFRFWQWTRLAIVGMLAGEMGSGGGFNVPTSFPSQSGSSRHLLGPGLSSIDSAQVVLIVVLVGAALVFGIVMMYVSSVMRFILFDSVLARECHIRQGWSRRQGPGWKYFLWQLGFMLATLGAAIVLFGIPVALGFAMGWFTAPGKHVLALVLGGIVVFFLLVAFLVAIAVVHVLTKDFVVPQMALEGISAMEAWRRLWPTLQGEKGGYAVYVGMKIVLAIGAGIVTGIASLIVLLVIGIPIVGVVIIAGQAAGWTWNVFTITAAVVGGCIALAALIYLMALLSVPAIVFFPAYSIYFFAPRYRPLSLVLYPPPSSLAPTPEPAG